MSKYVAIALFELAALLIFGWLVHDRNRLAEELKASRADVAQLEAAAEFASQTLAARDALDRKYVRDIADAKNEIKSLRADVAAGARRVLVKASCPSAVPGASSATSLDDGASAELATDARQDYFDLRDQIITTEKQLAGLQEYVGQVCQVRK